jgi:hypothetical protein
MGSFFIVCDTVETFNPIEASEWLLVYYQCCIANCPLVMDVLVGGMESVDVCFKIGVRCQCQQIIIKGDVLFPTTVSGHGCSACARTICII